MKWFFYLLKILAYVPLLVIFPVKVINGKRIPGKGKVITVSNHLSLLDIVIELANLRGFRYTLAKIELSKHKLGKMILSWLGAIYIDRGAADISATKKVLTVLKRNDGIAIFPEGTRNKKDEELMPIKEGAAMFAIKSKTPIIPVMIYTKQRWFRKNYIYVGEQFELSQFYGQRLDANVLKSASDIIEGNMRSAREQLHSYVEEKKSKKRKAKKNKDAVEVSNL